MKKLYFKYLLMKLKTIFLLSIYQNKRAVSVLENFAKELDALVNKVELYRSSKTIENFNEDLNRVIYFHSSIVTLKKIEKEEIDLPPYVLFLKFKQPENSNDKTPIKGYFNYLIDVGYMYLYKIKKLEPENFINF